MSPRAPEYLRQSQIARFDNCALSLLLDVEEPGSHRGNLAAIGTLWHRWVARAIKLMQLQGMTSIPVDVGLTELLDVIAQRDVEDAAVVHLPMAELKWLRIMVTRWCYDSHFDSNRVLAIEGEWSGTIAVPDGNGGFYPRKVVGHPDVVVGDPPDGIIIVDWKTGWSPPAKLGAEDEQLHGSEAVEVKDEKLTDQGYAQQVIYGILGLQQYPAVNKVTLREAYLRHGEYREATIERVNLERLMDVLGAVIAQIDAAFEAGPDSERWIPSAGVHCGICPQPRKCPLTDWHGIPTTLEEAQLLANEWIVAEKVRKERAPLLKGWVDVNGPVPVRHGKGRREVGWPMWDQDPDDGSSIFRGRGPFKLYEPVDAPESPWDERLAELIANRHG
jgi:hypothetical protein